MNIPLLQDSGITLDWMRKCRDFSVLKEKDQWKLMAKIKLIHCEKGEYIWRYKDQVNAVYLVFNGLVQLYGINSKGTVNTNFFVGERLMFGEFELFAGQNRCNHAKALSETTLIEIKKHDFLDVVQSDTRYLSWWLKKISSLTFYYCKIRAQMQGEYADKIILAGLDLALCSMEMARATMNFSRKHPVRLNISQEHFSSFIGLSRQVTNRELKQLEERGIVSLAYSSITILDQEAIYELLGGRY